MSDYIEREAVLAYPLRKDKCDREHANKHFIFGIESVIEFVEDLPAADVAPVRHGRWDENGRCTLCGGHAPFWAMASTYYKSPWCHECGARMDKEDKHEAD